MIAVAWSETNSIKGAPPPIVEPYKWGKSVSNSEELQMSVVKATCVANRHGEKSRGQCLVRAVVERAPLRPDRCVSYASNEVAKRPAPSGSYRLKTLHSETKTFTDPSLEPEVLNAIGAYAG